MMEPSSLANELMSLQQALTITSIAVGLVFGYAAWTKLVDVPGLVAAVRAYSIVPNQVAPYLAGLLITGEGIIAVAHIVGIGLRFIVPSTLGVLSIFFIIVASLLMRGERRPCLCFGAQQDEPVDVSNLTRVSVLWSAEALLCLLLTIHDEPMTVSTAGIYGHLQLFLLAALVVMLAGWFLSFPRIHRVWRIVRP